MYKYYQPNKKDIKDNYGDCVIRALTKVLNMSWVEVFDELVPVAREIQCNPNSRFCWRKYLDMKGFKKGIVSNKKGTKRPTVEEFANKHKKGTYICKVTEHIVAVVDGVYYDTWDCGKRSVYSYWEKPDNYEEPYKLEYMGTIEKEDWD